MSTSTTQYPLRMMAIAAVSCLLFVACQADSEPATTAADTSSSTTTTTEAIIETTVTTEMNSDVDSIAVVMSSFEAWNEGDFAGWLAYYADNDDDDDRIFSASVMNSNETITLEGECREVSESDRGTSVECPVSVADDFHGAGGLFSTAEMSFLVADDGLIADSSSGTYQDESGDCCPDWQAYHSDFFEWLESAHPEVYDEIGPSDGIPSWYLPGVASGDPEHMLVALDYVDEFVAQSDKYPLGETAAESLAPVVEPLGRGGFVSEVSGELTSSIDGAQSMGAEFGDASDIVFAKITIPAGGVAPWHTHTGPALLLNIGPGTLTSAVTEACLVEEIGPGSAFLDPGDGVSHAAVNHSDEEVVLYAVFLGVVENPVVGADPEGCDL